jgi:hypothetical protein
MNTRLFAFLIALFGMWGETALGLEVGGLTIDSKTRVVNQELALNGAGIRTRFMFKVYVAALYVAEPSGKAAQIINQPGAKRMQLTLLRDVGTDQLLDAMYDGLKKNLSPAERAELQGQLDQFSAIFRAAGDGRKGDRIALDWQPGQGTVVRINDTARGPALPGEPFYRALLRIWLGDHPVQESLRAELLGRDS